MYLYMNVKSSVATAIVFYHDTVYVCGVIIMIIIMKRHSMGWM